jgi:hypothetical protein
MQLVKLLHHLKLLLNLTLHMVVQLQLTTLLQIRNFKINTMHQIQPLSQQSQYTLEQNLQTQANIQKLLQNIEVVIL